MTEQEAIKRIYASGKTPFELAKLYLELQEHADIPSPPPPPPIRMVSEYGGVLNQHEIDAWNAKYGKDSK